MKKSEFIKNGVYGKFFILITAGIMMFFLSLNVKAEEGYFIKVDDKVYFREFGKDALEKTALWGNYFDNPTGKGESYISVYNKDTGEVEHKLKDKGTKLYYDKQRLYTEREHRKGEYNREVYTLDRNGENQKVLTYGRIEGLSDKGYLAVKSSDEGLGALEVFKNGKICFKIATEKTGTAIEYMGIAGDYMLYYKTNYSSSSNSPEIFAVKVNSDSKPVKLGKVNLTKEMADGIDVGNVRFKDGKLYFSLFYFGGTGHFISNGYVYQGNPKIKNSLKKISKDIYGKYEVQPVFQLDGKGKVKLSQYEQNEIIIEGKAVYLFESDGNKKLVVKDYTKLFDFSKTGEYSVAAANYIDEAVFMIVDKQKRNPKEDVGWREAYDILERYYIRIPLKGDIHSATVLHQNKF